MPLNKLRNKVQLRKITSLLQRVFSTSLFTAFGHKMSWRVTYCKQYGPRSDCSLRSSLIRVHSVCCHDKIQSAVHLNIYSRRKKQMTMLGQKCWWDKAHSSLSFRLIQVNLVFYHLELASFRDLVNLISFLLHVLPP